MADACGVYTEEQRKILLEDKGNGKYQLDLHQACYYNFTDAGVLPEHIALPDICTCCNPENYNSTVILPSGIRWQTRQSGWCDYAMRINRGMPGLKYTIHLIQKFRTQI